MQLSDLLRDAKPDLPLLPDNAFRSLVAQAIAAQREDRRENQIAYYKPVSEVACAVHRSTAKVCGIGGGNGASKTDTLLAEAVMLSTGVFSDQLDPDVRAALRAKFRGPIRVRVTVESLTTTLDPVILPKLQWWQWNGVDEPGGDRGHWGWIPRRCLRDARWVKSYDAKRRLLAVLCFDPDEPGRLLGESIWQFNSKDQDPTDFASGDFHLCIHDELPTYAIWRENEARTMRVGGRMQVAATWPDDPSIPVDWAYDLIYERGRPGPDKDPSVDWFEMYTTDNMNLKQEAVAEQSRLWDERMRAVRLRGQPIRFSNRVHPGFTDTPATWCVLCRQAKFDNRGCETCKGDPRAIHSYCHVKDFEIIPGWPTVFLLDPHPRKDHMGLWVQVDSWDDAWVAAECSVPGGPEEVRDEVARVEREFGFNVVKRIGDRNMLHSVSGAKRDVTWRDEFQAVGLALDDSDVSDVGRARIDDALKVDPNRCQPRLHFHPRCAAAIRQMKRYVWSDYKRPEDHAQKQAPNPKDDDYPSLLRYFFNFNPTYRFLLQGGGVIRTRGQ